MCFPPPLSLSRDIEIAVEKWLNEERILTWMNVRIQSEVLPGLMLSDD